MHGHCGPLPTSRRAPLYCFTLLAPPLPAEATIAKRRSYANTISYLTPPAENAGLYKASRSCCVQCFCCTVLGCVSQGARRAARMQHRPLLTACRLSPYQSASALPPEMSASLCCPLPCSALACRA